MAPEGKVQQKKHFKNFNPASKLMQLLLRLEDIEISSGISSGKPNKDNPSHNNSPVKRFVISQSPRVWKTTEVHSGEETKPPAVLSRKGKSSVRIHPLNIVFLFCFSFLVFSFILIPFHFSSIEYVPTYEKVKRAPSAKYHMAEV